MTDQGLRWLVTVALLLAPSVAAQTVFPQADTDALPVSGPRLFATTTDDGLSGALVELLPGRSPTSPDVKPLAATDGARLLRRFGDQLFLVNRFADTIQRVPLNGGPSQLYDLGRGADPMDVLVDAPSSGSLSAAGGAWVTRRDDPVLLRLDLTSGGTTESVDLSPVGGGATIALGTMARHGGRLLVQVRIVAGGAEAEVDTGVLAVVDLARGELIDVDRSAPGVQGIALAGAPPRFAMQILDDTLYVSTTESFNDNRGGIEKVDLAALTSVGFAITEAGGHADMGGFVMLDHERGYYVFHTDLLLSTHLVAFSVTGGPEPGGMIDLLEDGIDTLIHDPARRRLYLPGGYAIGAPGLYAFSTVDNELVGVLDTGLRPHDAVWLEGPLPVKAKRY